MSVAELESWDPSEEVIPPRRVTKVRDSRTALERSAIDGESPVDEISSSREGHPSTAEHVQFGGNLGGPSFQG
jgi:hypothetical protein